MNISQQIDELLTHWLASRDGKVTAEDLQQLLNCLVMMMATEFGQASLRSGKSVDDVNAELEKEIMPMMVKMQRKAMGEFNAFVNDPAAPSHSVN